MDTIRNKFRQLPVTYTLITINVIVYLITALLSFSTDISPVVLIKAGANFRQLVQTGQYYRLITSAFLHANLLHILFNMYSLNILGSTVEVITTKYRYLLIYFGAALGSGIASYLFSGGFSVGASGAIFGLLGVLIGWAYTRRDMFRRGALVNMLFIAALNLSWGFRTGSGIDNFAHIGGLVTGLVLSLILKPERRY